MMIVKREQRRGALNRGEDDVAIVLPSASSTTTDGTAGRNVGDRVVHGVHSRTTRPPVAGPRCRRAPCRGRQRRLTGCEQAFDVLAMDIDIEVDLLGDATPPRMVRVRVSGIRLTSNQCSVTNAGALTEDTVRLTPRPNRSLSARERESTAGESIPDSTCQRSAGRLSAITPVAVTLPWTIGHKAPADGRTLATG